MVDFLLPNRKRRKYIECYEITEGLLNKFMTKHPSLDHAQTELVIQALKQYFQVCLAAKGKLVAMPSKIVDNLWHEFILFTKDYHTFCEEAFGYYLHHTPTPTASDGDPGAFVRTWHLACKQENIFSGYPSSLPLLFDIDSRLEIEGGIYHSRTNILKELNNFKNTTLKRGGYICGSSCSSGSSSKSESSDVSILSSCSSCSSCGGD